MKTLNEIPFNYLVSWANANRNSHPELSFLRTLSGRPEADSFGLWGEVVAGLPPTAHLNKLTDALDKCRSLIELDYEDDSTTVVLPEGAATCGSFYERVKVFISQYILELSRPGATVSDKVYEGQRNRAAILKELFEYSPAHGDPTDRGLIAKNLRLTRQRVDQLVSEIRTECRNCLDGMKTGRVIADPVLVAEFVSFRKRVGTMISKESFRRCAGIPQQDGRTLAFLAEVLGMSVMDRNLRIPIVASSGLLCDYTKQVGDVIDFFRHEVIGIRPDIELRKLLDEEIADAGLREAFNSFILNSDEFIKYDHFGDTAVALNWKDLLSLPSRICWILHEKGAYDYKSAVHEDELVALYNTYARRYGEERITVKQLPRTSGVKECWRPMTLGRSGYWKIRQRRNEEYNIDETIRDYLISSGSGASFDEFITRMKQSGEARLYQESSLRSRYTACGGTIPRKVARRGKVTVLDGNMRDARYGFILNYLSGLGRVCTTKDITDEVQRSYPGTNPATVAMWVKDLSRSGKLNLMPGTGRRPSYVSALSVKLVPPKTVKDDLIEKALEILWDAPSHVILKKDLYAQLIAALPDDINSKIQFVSRSLLNDARFVFSDGKTSKTVSLSPGACTQMAKQRPTASAANPEAAPLPAAPKLDIPAVKHALVKEFSSELKLFGIDAGRASDNLLTIIGKGAMPTGGFSFFDLLTFIPRHYDGKLEPDRERAMKKDCLSLVELFLKNYYELKHGGDIVSAIQDEWNMKNVGLRTIVAYLEKEYSTLPFKVYGTKEERKVSQMIDDVINARNWIVGHPDQWMDTSKYNQEKNIHDSFFVMLYVSSKF